MKALKLTAAALTLLALAPLYLASCLFRGNGFTAAYEASVLALVGR